jgi:putative two-component system response regulator
MRKQIVLVVDDMDINRDILAEILEEQYSVICAENGRKAIEIMKEHELELAVILLDLIMPVMDGYEVLEYMNINGYLDKIPVLVISGENSISVEKKCLDLGASDFIRKPFDNALVRKRVKNIAELYSYKNNLEDIIKQQLETLRQQNHLLQIQKEELLNRNLNIIDILGTVVECRDMESGEHIQRVRAYTKIIAYQMMKDYPEYELTEEIIDVISSASALHDIGKIAISDSILLKPGRLTQEEYEEMKKHTTKGCDILDQIRGAWDAEYGRYSYEICRYHHERFDGRGYPDKLVADQIPISAQLVSIADVYDALVNDRVYKKAYPKDVAFKMIMNGECGIFSPKLLDAFQKVRAEFESLN